MNFPQGQLPSSGQESTEYWDLQETINSWPPPESAAKESDLPQITEV